MSSIEKILGVSFIQHEQPVLDPELKDIAVVASHDCVNPKLAIDTKDLPSRAELMGSPSDPLSAAELRYGANQFLDSSIVVAKGFFLIVNKDNRTVANLYLHRTRGGHDRVAQVVCDQDIPLKAPNSIVTKVNSGVRIDAGVMLLRFDVKWFFLSKLTFS